MKLPNFQQKRILYSLIWLPWLVGTACTLSLFDTGSITPTDSGTSIPTQTPQPTPIPLASVAFNVIIPENTPANNGIQISILDEVTGLALNPKKVSMEQESAAAYSTNLQIPLGTVLKYRYTRQGNLPAEEHIADGRPVRYRMYYVNGPGEVNDVITRWNDTSYSGQTGRINGQIRDAVTGEALPSILVVAGGVQVLTAWDGTFLIEGLPPGTQNLVAYALDGKYNSYQQGAVVAPESTTPAFINMTPAPEVNITFHVLVPEGTIPGIPIRLAGNLYQLGNTFSDLSGGISTPSYRLPLLKLESDGQYSITLSLPISAHIQYKYTLGDGFWNAERLKDGKFNLREIIIPEHEAVIEDSISTWASPDTAAIWFDVTVPENTPDEDVVYIQFNPYGWTQPIPMWRLEEKRWVYLLSSPLDLMGTIEYRYCRKAQCGSADDERTFGVNAIGRPVHTSLIFQNIQDQVNNWRWLDSFSGNFSPGDLSVSTKPGFNAGIELLSKYHPSWSSFMPDTFRDIQAIGANWVIQTPTWSFTRSDPPILESVNGTDISWIDQEKMIAQAEGLGLKVGLFPTPNFPIDQDQWWQEAPRDFPWWTVWFERYEVFLKHYAGLAAQNNVSTLILGGDWLTPALPNGYLLDGFSSGVPIDADERWRNLINDIRQEFSGTIAWAIPFPQVSQNPPSFLELVDQIILLWDAPLSDSTNSSTEELNIQAAHLLDNQAFPIILQFNKPILVALSFPSADGGIKNCLEISSGTCLNIKMLSQPAADYPNITVDLKEQVDAYNAFLQAVSQREWISGVISKGYYPPTILRDKSISVHGKPAELVLKYWYPRLQGLNP